MIYKFKLYYIIIKINQLKKFTEVYGLLLLILLLFSCYKYYY